jgi:hypothetical protein
LSSDIVSIFNSISPLMFNYPFQAYLVQGNKIKVLRGADETEFKFSTILSENSSQTEVFEHAARNAVESFLDGQDCLVFAYGTTNAGKTFSVQGDVF